MTRGQDQQCCQASGDKVEEVVEAGAGPAEMQVALVPVPDHAVQGVDGLVGKEARQACDQEPEGRRHHPIGQVLGQQLDRRPAHGCLVQPLRVPAHDPRYRQAPLPQPAPQAEGHVPDMLDEAALGQERARHQRQPEPAERQRQQQPLHCRTERQA